MGQVARADGQGRTAWAGFVRQPPPGTPLDGAQGGEVRGQTHSSPPPTPICECLQRRNPDGAGERASELLSRHQEAKVKDTVSGSGGQKEAIVHTEPYLTPEGDLRSCSHWETHLKLEPLNTELHLFIHVPLWHRNSKVVFSQNFYQSKKIYAIRIWGPRVG